MAVMKFIILGSFWVELLGRFHSRRLYICRLKLGTGVIFIGKSKMAGQNFCGAASSQTFFPGGGHSLAVLVWESQFPGENLLGFGEPVVKSAGFGRREPGII